MQPLTARIGVGALTYIRRLCFFPLYLSREYKGHLWISWTGESLAF
jgi:hypothetical protein